MELIKVNKKTNKRISVRFSFQRLLILMVAMMAAMAFVACDSPGDNDDDEGGGNGGGNGNGTGNGNGNGNGKVWVDKQGGAQNVAYADLYTAITTIGTEGSAGKYTVRVGENQQLIHNLIVGKPGFEVILKADDKPVEITMNPILPQENFVFLIVLNGASVTLDKGITFKGKGEAASATAAVVTESELIMNDGATITNFGGEGTLEAVSIGINANFVMNGGSISNNYKRGVGVNYYSTFIMNGGVISKNTYSDEHGGAGVFVYNYANFTMNDGTISENVAISGPMRGGKGGGVNVAGGSVGATFNMKGGTISNNIAEDSGGGVYIYGSNDNAAIFTIEGGTIKGNTAEEGGGVFVESYSSTESGVFTMKGGTIEENVAGSGGGVYNIGICTMSGGTIAKNTASNSGGGVSTGSRFTKTGGVITGYGDPNGNKILREGPPYPGGGPGHAVYADYMKKRELTATEATNLNGSIEGSAGGWDNLFDEE